MFLDEILQQLALGPLQEQPIGAGGVISAEDRPKILLLVNSALRALYTRFPLRVRQLTIATIDGRYNYPLETRYAQTSASGEVDRFIQDTVADPFTGDVLRVQSIYDVEHTELPFNDRNDPLSWHQTGYDTLTMDYPKTGTSFFVEYRARHDRIPLVVNQPETVVVRIPPELEDALLHHVAWKFYAGMSNESGLAKAKMHQAFYEAECVPHEAENTFAGSTDSTNRKPEQGGWI